MSATRTYGRFVALTAVNPLTAVTFTTIAVGLAVQVDGAGSVAAFVVGVGLASLAWQLLLAVGSGLLGLRLPPAARTWVSVVGSVRRGARRRRARRLRVIRWSDAASPCGCTPGRAEAIPGSDAVPAGRRGAWSP